MSLQEANSKPPWVNTRKNNYKQNSKLKTLTKNDWVVMNQTFCFLMCIHQYMLQFNWSINYNYVIVHIWIFTSADIISVTY